MNKLEHSGTIILILALLVTTAWLAFANRGQSGWGAMAAGPLQFMATTTAVLLIVFYALAWSGQIWALWVLRSISWMVTAIVFITIVQPGNTPQVPLVPWVALAGGCLGMGGFVWSRL